MLLSKLDSKKYISVELPMDDMDLTSAESKATYKQIQNYVLEKFGFKVSTLYIAQVKKKHGLEVREHYNISKNENQKSSVTPELTAAIAEALEARELIKITVLKNCLDDGKSIAQVLAERTRSEVVQVIGKKIVLYKPAKDESRRKIVLPD